MYLDKLHHDRTLFSNPLESWWSLGNSSPRGRTPNSSGEWKMMSYPEKWGYHLLMDGVFHGNIHLEMDIWRGQPSVNLHLKPVHHVQQRNNEEILEWPLDGYNFSSMEQLVVESSSDEWYQMAIMLYPDECWGPRLWKVVQTSFSPVIFVGWSFVKKHIFEVKCFFFMMFLLSFVTALVFCFWIPFFWTSSKYLVF